MAGSSSLLSFDDARELSVCSSFSASFSSGAFLAEQLVSGENEQNLMISRWKSLHLYAFTRKVNYINSECY
jgi:hypothetical protein